MLAKLKQYPLRVLIAVTFLLLMFILVAVSVPGLAIGFALTGGLVWSLGTIIKYLDRNQ
jgi:hypothetical protein